MATSFVLFAIRANKKANDKNGLVLSKGLDDWFFDSTARNEKTPDLTQRFFNVVTKARLTPHYCL